MKSLGKYGHISNWWFVEQARNDNVQGHDDNIMMSQ